MSYTWAVVLIFSTSLGILGCASSNTMTKSSVPLDGSAWVLSSLPGRSLVPDVTPTARFEAGQITGTDGCNRYSMPFTAKGSTIEIGPLGPSTSMACPERTMEQAAIFKKALLDARSFRHGTGMLDLLDSNGEVVATLTAQAESLAGTSWNVTNINNGRQAVVSIVPGSTVTMVFDTEGRVSGTTGCNQFTASYSVDGNNLQFSSAATTRRACADPGVDEQEKAFLHAFESVRTMHIEGDLLVLRQEDGAMAIILKKG